MSRRPAPGRFVLDTNVLVSAVLVAGSVSGRALVAALEHGVVLVSEATVAEVADVLGRPKFDRYVTAEERARFLAALLQDAELVQIEAEVQVCRDPKDDKFRLEDVGGLSDRIVRHLAVLLLVLTATGCAGSRGIPLCSDEQRDALLTEIHAGDDLLAAGDTTGAWWAYTHATAWTGTRERCRDRLREPGEFGRALAFAAMHADTYVRDSSSVWRRGHPGPVDYYIDGVRLDSFVARLYEVDLPATLAQ